MWGILLSGLATYVGVGFGYSTGAAVGASKAFEDAGVDYKKLTIEEYEEYSRHIDKFLTQKWGIK